MRRVWGLGRVAVLAAAVVAASGTGQRASAHDHGTAGSLEIVFGWEHEPTYSGIPNAVHVSVLDAHGDPVVDDAAQLTVTLTFGELSVTRPLVPLRAPGEFSALVVPTEAGTYSFHIMGSIAGETVDVSSTCSDETFHCVVDAAEVRFPGDDPAENASDRATAVTTVATDDESIGIATIIALMLAGLAVVGVVLIGTGVWRPARRS